MDSPIKDMSGYIYIIRSGSLFKIGKTANVESRLSTLQTGSSEKLELIHVIPSDNCIGAEREMQERFKYCRRQGEWFELSANDLKQIKLIDRLDGIPYSSQRIYRITMSDQGYRAIAELARDEDKPMAAVIREALEEHLRRKGKPTAMRVEWGGYRPRQEPEK